RGGRVPVRVLHARTDRPGVRPAGRGAPDERPGAPARDVREHLPLHRLHADHRRDPQGGGAAGGGRRRGGEPGGGRPDVTAPATPRVVGASVPPKKWDERTSGADPYAGDLDPPGTLTAHVLRSPHPYARILSIDTERARRMPGVHAVITAADFPEDAVYVHSEGPHSDRRPLARDVVRFVGEEVAAVAAETAEQARAAAEAIVVRYRVPRRRPPLTMDAASGRRAVRLHRRSSGEPNVSVHDKGQWGDPEAGRSAATMSVEGTFHYPRVAHACMEPNTTLAHWHADTGVLELWTSTQAPWFVTTEVAHVLGLDPARVVCRDVAVGGGFGSKSKVCEHEALAARSE